MAKRRPSGDGMVRKREDGRWEGRIVIGHKENGSDSRSAVRKDSGFCSKRKALSSSLRKVCPN